MDANSCTIVYHVWLTCKSMNNDMKNCRLILILESPCWGPSCLFMLRYLICESILKELLLFISVIVTMLCLFILEANV